MSVSDTNTDKNTLIFRDVGATEDKTKNNKEESQSKLHENEKELTVFHCKLCKRRSKKLYMHTEVPVQKFPFQLTKPLDHKIQQHDNFQTCTVLTTKPYLSFELINQTTRESQNRNN